MEGRGKTHEGGKAGRDASGDEARIQPMSWGGLRSAVLGNWRQFMCGRDQGYRTAAEKQGMAGRASYHNMLKIKRDRGRQTGTQFVDLQVAGTIFTNGRSTKTTGLTTRNCDRQRDHHLDHQDSQRHINSRKQTPSLLPSPRS